MRAPSPMLVKKLMANLVSLGLSLGISPSQASAMVASRDLRWRGEIMLREKYYQTDNSLSAENIEILKLKIFLTSQPILSFP